MRPSRPSMRVGERHDADVRHRGRRGAADRPRDRRLVALGIERAGGDEGARGRAADAGIAMHHQRRGAVPAAHEVDQARRHARRRARRSRRCGSLMSSMRAADGCRPAMLRGRCTSDRSSLEQRHDVARAGLCDRVVQAGEGADVNDHGSRISDFGRTMIRRRWHGISRRRDFANRSR